MEVMQANVGGLLINHCNGVILGVDWTDERKKNKAERSIEILAKINEFKERGAEIVKTELVEAWKEMMDIAIENPDEIYYKGVIIAACIECMELLSKGQPIEISYKPIDVDDVENPAIQFNMILSGCQNYIATGIVSTYHIRGKEFCDYRNAYVKIME